MTHRSTPTVRQQRLGIELRRLRERAGMTATEAAVALGLTQSRISNIEVGRLGVSPDRVRLLAQGYGCSDTALINALAAMAESRSRHWWEEYRGVLAPSVLDLAEMEHHATSIVTTQVFLLPGLLQTTDYSRVVVRQNIPELPPPMAEQYVSIRLRRQQVLYREPPTPYTALIHEAALRMQFGGVEVTRNQLKHIIAMSERPNVTVRVVPFTAGVIPGCGQTVLYAAGPVSQLDTVQLDVEHGCVFLHAEAQLEKYRTFVQRFERASLDAARSRDFVHKIVKAL